jgi:predicted RNA-binding Zn-ribbon protein involved in translation (DUF1610 family)
MAPDPNETTPANRSTSDATDEQADEVLDFACPRCGATFRDRFYGPCANCRNQLRATVGGQAREVTVGDYEPKMNVTPNAVALKD